LRGKRRDQRGDQIELAGDRHVAIGDRLEPVHGQAANCIGTELLEREEAADHQQGDRGQEHGNGDEGPSPAHHLCLLPSSPSTRHALGACRYRSTTTAAVRSLAMRPLAVARAAVCDRRTDHRSTGRGARARDGGIP
jgi:hypothetical protein